LYILNKIELVIDLGQDIMPLSIELKFHDDLNMFDLENWNIWPSYWYL